MIEAERLSDWGHCLAAQPVFENATIEGLFCGILRKIAVCDHGLVAF
jgi:hypothetical protein